MELEFDKEIDAILRKARGGGTVAVMAASSPHLDADTVAAFAENALPTKARMLYMEHFADCDRCRRMLSNSMLLNSEADATAASPVFMPVVAATIPWYQKLFKTKNLAIAMGALVLVFGGVLAVIVMQNRQSDSNASVAKMAEPEMPQSGPSFNSELPAPAANAAAAANTAVPATPAANTANTASSAPAAPGEPTVNKPGVLSDKLEAAPGGSSADSSFAQREERPKDTTVMGGVAPPLPAAKSAPVLKESDEKKLDDEATKNVTSELELAKRKQAEIRGRADQPPAASKSGPARSGPLQSQSNQINNIGGDMLVTRSVGGKSFNNRNGVWYDSAYKSQATNNYRRNSSEYKKLDGGLRSIADTLGGTVVLIWKDKAYRIQ